MLKNNLLRFGTSVLIVMLLLMLLGGCATPVMQRNGYPGSGDIVFAVPGSLWTEEEGQFFLKGMDMALEEVNQRGVIGGRRIAVEVVDDEGSFMTGTSLAQSFAENPAIAAVIGHWNTHITLPAAAIYEEAGLLLLSPIVSNVQLTRQGYEYVFQNIVGDDEIGRQMAVFAREQGLERTVIFYSDTDYGRGLANAFEDAAHENGMLVVERLQGFRDSYDQQRAIQRWEALGYDNIFVASSLADSVDFIAGIREAGVDKLILGGDGLDFGYIERLGPLAERSVIATMLNPAHTRPELQQFIHAFIQTYNMEPDIWAIQGYDSIKLLTHAIEMAESAAPVAVAQMLHNMDAWEGVLNTFYFNERGELQGMNVFQKIVQDGRFEYL